MTGFCAGKLRFISRLIIGLLLMFLLNPAYLPAHNRPEANSDLNQFRKKLDTMIPVEMKKYDISGLCIALVQNGEIIWSEAYDYADRESSRKMTTDAHCRVESISKSVTAWSIMKLAEEGVIHLEDSVGMYLKETDFTETDPHWRSVTIHLLLSHTAGFPLGMTRSGFTISPEELPMIPVGYETDGTPVPPYVYPVHASGGFMATVNDIARFLTAGVGGGLGVLHTESLKRMYFPQTEVKGLYGFVTDAYGLVHFVEVLSDGTNAVWHGGQGHG